VRLMIHHSARRLRVVAVAAVGFALPAIAADWPQWRGPLRDGVSRESGLLSAWPAGGPKLVLTATGLGDGFSSVAVTGGRIFTMGDVAGGQHVIALGQKDGRPLWKARVGPTWDDDYGGPRGTPTIDGDLLYAVGTEGDVVCLEVATGKERWRRSLPNDFGGRVMSVWKFSESPLVDGGRVIVTPGVPEAALVALDKLTGKEVWRTATPDLGPKGKDGAGYSSVVVSNGAGVKQYVQLTGRGLIGVRASDGKLLWGYNRVANHVANISTPVISGDHVFASTGYGTGSALVRLRKSGDGVAVDEIYWLDASTFQNHHGGFVLVGDHIYGGQGQKLGFPICIELLTGKIAWGGKTRNEGQGSAAIASADGEVYYRYENGTVILVEATPTGYKPKGLFQIPGVTKPSWPHPAISGGRLYLREQDKLYVYDVSKS
jgi:outer membrane protein assembly factor BamB